MFYPIDPAYITTQLQRLVQIDSTNPTLGSANAGEAAIAAYLASELARLGLEVQTYEVAPGRPNVVGTLRGTGDGPALLLNGHMDTVGVAGMSDPFGAAIENGRLYGRGAQDMKGSLAAMLGAVKALRDGGVFLRGNLIVAFVIDEETISLGTADLVRHVQAHAAIVTEPTELRVTLAHRGFVWLDVETRGRAAHGSRFDEGVDAIMHMGRFLAALDGLEQALRARPAHPLVGPPSLHASIIKGGSEISVYPALCRLSVERRTLPGESAAAVTAELQALIDALMAADPAVQATVRVSFERDPFEVSPDAAIVHALDKAAARQIGQRLPHAGATFWTDAAILAGAGMETALIGPKGGGLHSDVEWVDLGSVHDLAAILAETAVLYCGARA
jgi:acetylornithine deacetylase